MDVNVQPNAATDDRYSGEDEEHGSAITSFPDIEVVVDNQILLDDIMKIKGRIRNTLALALKNSAITLNIRLAKPEEIKPILTNKERFDELKRENKAFEKLSEMLKLEIN